jgi:LAS superfamily LD-carboxypeptidase LdcB
MTPAQLTGKSIDHIVAIAAPACEIHVGVRQPLLDMVAAAKAAGIDLVPASGFRSFERQLTIWNAKFSGQRPIYDTAGNVLDALSLSPRERVAAILLFSAVPGASRHHWGTDLDLIDRRAIPPGYRVQLVAAEFEPGGPFAKLARWLDREAARFGFFRPYRGVLSHVAPEPWHWSYAPLAEPARVLLTPELLREAVENAPILGKECLLGRISDLHSRFVSVIDPPGADCFKPKPLSGD